MEHDTTVVGCIHDEALSRLSDQVKFESVEIQDENKTWFGELCVGKDGFWVSSKSDASCSMWVKATDLVLQAICRDGPSKPGIYCQIQGEGDEETFQTIYIIPTESCYVEKIFEALCELVRRNPVSVVRNYLLFSLFV